MDPTPVRQHGAAAPARAGAGTSVAPNVTPPATSSMRPTSRRRRSTLLPGPVRREQPEGDGTDSDPVEVIDPNITLAKSVPPTMVLIGSGRRSEPVTYTYEAKNTGTPTLDRPGATTAARRRIRAGSRTAAAPRRRCTSAAIRTSRPTTCSTPARHGRSPVPLGHRDDLNFAGILAQPSDGTGAPLAGVDPSATSPWRRSRSSGQASRSTRRHSLASSSTAVPCCRPEPRGSVARSPTSRRLVRPGTGTRSTTRATSRYAVNPVPPNIDPNPPVDDICGPLVFEEGDADADDLLDVPTRHGFTHARRRSTGTSTPNRSRSVTCRRPCATTCR